MIWENHRLTSSQNKSAKTLEFSCDGLEQNVSRQCVSMDHGGFNEQTISRKYPLDHNKNGNDGTFGGTHHFALLSSVTESAAKAAKKDREFVSGPPVHVLLLMYCLCPGPYMCYCL
jgi:hypothetical protein